MKPDTIQYISKTNSLEITWDSGTEQSFPTHILRGFCPCAGCQGHGAGLAKFIKTQRESGLRIDNVTPVGNYGMCVIWGDGHDTGIYSFQTLLRFDLARYQENSPEEGERLTLLDTAIK